MQEANNSLERPGLFLHGGRPLSIAARLRPPITAYRFVPPEDFAAHGIDPDEIPVGTFVAEDHPPFLASRFGGNAYGFGIIEHRHQLDADDLAFLERLDFSSPATLGRHHRRLNHIYHKLGLLMRFSRYGKRYYLIPINWVSHSLEDVRDRVDEIEKIVIKQAYDLQKERLNVGLLAAADDLVIHELSSRMPAQRLVLINTLESLRQSQPSFDLIVVPQDIADLLASLGLGAGFRGKVGRQSYKIHGTYVAGKIYDLLGPQGCLVVVANRPFPEVDEEAWVEFRHLDEFRNFLYFSHVYRCRKRYRGRAGRTQKVHLADFYNYLSGIFVSDAELAEITGGRDPSTLEPAEIDSLPYLELKISKRRPLDMAARWRALFKPFFEEIACYSKVAPSLEHTWRHSYLTESPPPDLLQIFVGRKRQPPVELAALEQREGARGMAGCRLALVAGYKNSFEYVYRVLEAVNDIRAGRLETLAAADFQRLEVSCLERRRVPGPFRPLKRLLQSTQRLRRLETLLNPDGIEGKQTKILENIEKLGLLGVDVELLRELYLIVVGHTSGGRITFGKMPEVTMKAATDWLRRRDPREALDLLGLIRLMSMAEVAASLGEKFTREQALELFGLYDRAARMATDTTLSWEDLDEGRSAESGGPESLAVRQMLKMFNLFEFLEIWQELGCDGHLPAECSAGGQGKLEEKIGQVLELVHITSRFKERFYPQGSARGGPYFFHKLLWCQFHGTGHIFPRLGARAGFMLLWICVNASPGKVINFNPLVRAEVDDAAAIDRVKKAVEILDPTTLDLDYLHKAKEALRLGRSVVISHSGIRLQVNSSTQALDVHCLDPDRSVQILENFLAAAGSRRVADMPVASLEEADRHFGELQDFATYLREDPIAGQPALGQAKIGLHEVCQRVQALFAANLLVPACTYDTLEVLLEHCPHIGQQLLGEFWDLHRIKPQRPSYQGETIPRYVLRCLKKFQALVNRDRQALQSIEVFYHLAQQQFGAMTGEAIGLSPAQIEILESLVTRLRSRPDLLKALCAALLLQEIGKLPAYLPEYEELSAKATHAAAGVELLRKRHILARLALDPTARGIVEFLVGTHGLVGHVIRGEVALVALEEITRTGDELLFEAFFLLSTLAAAAFSEGVMVEDLLDRFLDIRQLGLEVIRTGCGWERIVHRLLTLKAEGLLGPLQEEGVAPGTLALFSDWRDEPNGEELLAMGDAAAALERLFRLAGIAEVDFADVQMRCLQMPLSFVYHRKGLKSIGRRTFEDHLARAMACHRAVMDLDEEIRRFLLEHLSITRDRVRIYGLDYLATHLEPEAVIKLLLLALAAIDRTRPGRKGRRGGAWTIDFMSLGASIGLRQQPLAAELARHDAGTLMDVRFIRAAARNSTGICLRIDREERSVRLQFEDRVRLGSMLRRLAATDHVDHLKATYHRGLQRLRLHPYPTDDYQRQLSAAYHRRLWQLLQARLQEAEEEMRLQESRQGLERIYRQALRLLEESGYHETEEVLRLKEVYDFNWERLAAG